MVLVKTDYKQRQREKEKSDKKNRHRFAKKENKIPNFWFVYMPEKQKGCLITSN